MRCGIPAPGGEPWNPAPFAESLGIWMGTYSGLETGYSNDYLTNWSWNREGWLEATTLARIDDGNGDTTDPVPEPATLTLLGLGAAGLLGARRRKKKA